MLTRFVKAKTQKIQENDRVLIHGIYIDHNYRNDKAIIQLVAPGSEGNLNNSQRIEVPSKFIKIISKSGSVSDNMTPEAFGASNNGFENTSRDDHEEKTDSSTDTKTHPQTKCLTERDIRDEWELIVGENDISSMELDASETCDSWKLNDCDSIKRVLFCLSYYRLWIMHKHQQQSSYGDENFYFQYLRDFIGALRDYSSKQMQNDFQHISHFHIQETNHFNNHSINAEDKQDVFEFFKHSMGICNHLTCRSFSRNHRNRDECTESDKLRQDLYFIDGENEFYKLSQSDEIIETNIQQLFDMIHCSLLHAQSSLATSGKHTSSKFITEVDKTEEEEAEEAAAEEEVIETAVLSSYGFGAQFKYHEKTHKNYIRAKYRNLKCESLENKLYIISEFDFESILRKAEQYLESYRGRTLIARKQSNLNNICGIKPNTRISVAHIVALMLYTNMDRLQKEYKKGCRYLASDKLDIQLVKERNREIAHWCRLLWESTTFYGESITKKQVFYHGLNCKLLFDSVIAAFNCPTSTTVNKSVAFNFSTEKGIIVQLSKFASLDSHFLNVSDLSDYPNEEERLFFQAQLGFQDIIYENTSNKYFIKCLSLFQNITKGNFFTHDTKIFKNKHQKTLCKMMDALIASEEEEEDLNLNNKIPPYMQQLFEHNFVSIKQFGNIIWINKEEFSKLNDKIRDYLAPNNTFVAWLKKKYKIKIKYTKTVSYVVKNHDEDENKNYLDLFWEGKSVMLPQIFYTVLAGKRKDKISLKLKLKKGATTNDAFAMIMCKISNNVLPQHIQKLKCDIGIFCPQINFSYTTAMTVSKKLQGIPLCESTKLEGLDAFEWKIFIKFRGRVDKKNLITKL